MSMEKTLASIEAIIDAAENALKGCTKQEEKDLAMVVAYEHIRKLVKGEPNDTIYRHRGSEELQESRQLRRDMRQVQQVRKIQRAERRKLEDVARDI